MHVKYPIRFSCLRKSRVNRTSRLQIDQKPSFIKFSRFSAFLDEPTDARSMISNILGLSPVVFACHSHITLRYYKNFRFFPIICLLCYLLTSSIGLITHYDLKFVIHKDCSLRTLCLLPSKINK